ncbi:hypothetical protein AWZ03_002050 [Drosophila navojoa]|uniref:Odorant receptor n=1 Tax=Drosophila navojoa TaxID=7232 RepID=A0A484BU41_DRONA|nr:odorant receptor 59a [Drosophila navojoa]TDG51590.1 hypothetical protein AWZ03_002050 [Drosophila navojoa]
MKRNSEKSDAAIDSMSFFRSHWAVWKFVGATFEKMNWNRLYIGYSLILNVFITIWFPTHMSFLLFRNDSLSDNISNLAMVSTCASCSFKTFIGMLRFRKIGRMEQLLRQLDARVKTEQERDVYRWLKTQLRVILYLILSLYVTLGFLAEIGFVVQQERVLMYPGWFPFDWAKSTRSFYVAHVYQSIGLGVQIMQNYANDCFPAMMLCITAAHIKMLYMRFEKVGEDPTLDAEQQLEACITDHKTLLELFRTLESFMSLQMLIQFAVSGVNLCTSIVALVLSNEPLTIAYFTVYTVGLPLQIFPACYYGTDVELWFGKLPYAAFSCRWLAQTRSFKKKLMLFVERSLKRTAPMAGGMLTIHVSTFFSTLKFVYSLFSILIRMRK